MMRALLARLWSRLLSPLTLELDGFGRAPLSRLTRVAPGIYLSARPDPDWVPELKRAGVTHVVSCLEPADEGDLGFLREGFEHLFIGLHDGMHEDMASVFPRFFTFCADATPPANRSGSGGGGGGEVAVHCHSGVSRSPTLVIAQLMKQRGQRFIDTYRDVKARRGQVLPNIGFASQLQRLEHRLLPETRRRSPSSLAVYLFEVCNVPADIDLIQSVLAQRDFDAEAAIRTLFGGDIPRVVQGVKR